MSPARVALAAGTAFVLVVALSACGGDDPGNDAATDTTTTVAEQPTTTAAPATSTTEPPESDVETISVEVRDGRVVDGSRRARIDLGSSVRIEVSSDFADEVHVHGYDLFEAVEAGGRAVVEFVADIPGVFEVELEERRLKLLELEVR